MVNNQIWILPKAGIHKLLELLFLGNFALLCAHTVCHCFQRNLLDLRAPFACDLFLFSSLLQIFPRMYFHLRWERGGAHITQGSGNPRALSCWWASLLPRASWRSRQLIKQKPFLDTFTSSFKALFSDAVAWGRRQACPLDCGHGNNPIQETSGLSHRRHCHRCLHFRLQLDQSSCSCKSLFQENLPLNRYNGGKNNP